MRSYTYNLMETLDKLELGLGNPFYNQFVINTYNNRHFKGVFYGCI